MSAAEAALGVELGRAGEGRKLRPCVPALGLVCVRGGFLIRSFGCVSEGRETSGKIRRNSGALGDKVPLACSVKQLRQLGARTVRKRFGSVFLAVQPPTERSVTFCSA